MAFATGHTRAVLTWVQQPANHWNKPPGEAFPVAEPNFFAPKLLWNYYAVDRYLLLAFSSGHLGAA